MVDSLRMGNENGLWNGKEQHLQQQHTPQKGFVYYIKTHMMKFVSVLVIIALALSLHHSNNKRYQKYYQSIIECDDCDSADTTNVMGTSATAQHTGAITSSTDNNNDDNGHRINYDEKEKDIFIVCATITVLYHTIETQAVIDTWGHRCDKLLFFTHRQYPFANPNATISYISPATAADPTSSNTPVNRYYSTLYDPSWEFFGSVIKTAYEAIPQDKSAYIVLSTTNSFVIVENIKRKIAEMNLEKSTNPVVIGNLILKSNTLNVDGLIMNQHAAKMFVKEKDNSASKCEAVSSSVCKPKTNSAACLTSCISKISEINVIYAKDKNDEDQIRKAPHHFAKMQKDMQAYSIRPMIFTYAGDISTIKTGYFSYLYFYDYFLYRTATNGFERLRPLSKPDVKIWAQTTWRLRRRR